MASQGCIVWQHALTCHSKHRWTPTGQAGIVQGRGYYDERTAGYELYLISVTCMVVYSRPGQDTLRRLNLLPDWYSIPLQSLGAG
jgi:hypothetical protein